MSSKSQQTKPTIQKNCSVQAVVDTTNCYSQIESRPYKSEQSQTEPQQYVHAQLKPDTAGIRGDEINNSLVMSNKQDKIRNLEIANVSKAKKRARDCSSVSSMSISSKSCCKAKDITLPIKSKKSFHRLRKNQGVKRKTILKPFKKSKQIKLMSFEGVKRKRTEQTVKDKWMKINHKL